MIKQYAQFELAQVKAQQALERISALQTRPR